MGFLQKFNDSIANSFVGKFFKLKERETTATTELRAGAATFVTMAYIISTNALILADTGGPCECPTGLCLPSGSTRNEDYEKCVSTVKQSLTTATAASALIGTLLMGIGANLPIALAPGLGVNAYFAYTVVGYRGTGTVKYKTALAAVFIEGIIFLILSIFGIRQWLARIIPKSIRAATAAGIGLFLCFIGLQSSAGINLVANDSSTLVTLGGCSVKDDEGNCTSGELDSAKTWMGILGLMLISVMLVFKVKGNILIAVLFISIISWFRGTLITYFPYTTDGDSAFDYFKQVVAVPSLEKIGGALEFNLGSKDVWIALITFLYVDILDATGTLYSMASFGGYMKPNGDFSGANNAFMADASAISIGALMGTSPVTAFIESATGIAEGGRTGLTSVFVAFFFFLSLFFTPIFSSIPPWATGPALIYVGSLMVKNANEVNWKYAGDSIPAFITMTLMPFTYSIAYGLVGGIGSYIVINLFTFVVEKISFGKIDPSYKADKEPWPSVEGAGAYILPKWVRKSVAKVRGVELTEKYKTETKKADADAENPESKELDVDIETSEI